jgi:ABC-type branched-subunit amino acid transport system ATPase component
MSALDNVALSVAERHGAAARLWRPASSYSEVRDEAFELLGTFGLAGDARTRLADLPYGKQRLIEIAIALGLKPRVLLLDEPAAGVPSLESGMILQALDRLPEKIAILIIEHDMDVVLRFASFITVLVEGKVLCEGPPAEIMDDVRVQRVYLGERRG